MREKERSDNCYYLFSTLVLQNSTMIFMIESLLCCHFHILVGIFHYRTWLVYSNDGLPQNALGLREKGSWMHTHLVSFDELSYIYRSSASVAWQSLLLILTSIDGHLHSPLISRVNVRLSPFLSSPHNPYHHTLLHPQCYIHGLHSCIASGLKKLKHVKNYEPIAWLKPGLCMMGVFCVRKMKHSLTI